MSSLVTPSSTGGRVWFVDAVGIVIGQPLAGSVLSAPQPIGSSIGAYGLTPGQIVCVAYYMDESYTPNPSMHGLYVIEDDEALTWTKLERQPRPASLATGKGGDVVVIRSGEGFGYRLYPTAWDDGSVLYLDPNRDYLTRWFSTALGLNINPDGSLDGNFGYHAHVVVNDLRNRVRDVLLVEHEVDLPQANEEQVNAALATVLGMGEGGTPGPAGASAYQVAVANGFEGDETAWLLSLVGQPGAAGADGVGSEGPQGEPGLSAYEMAVAGGFVGTEEQWLESLKGEPGQDGADGVGLPGQDGNDGKSAYELAVESGFVGTQAQWLASLKGDTGNTGATGSTGPAGASATVAVGTTSTSTAGSNATVTNSGTSSAAVLNFSIPRGEKGDTGPTGSTGPAGTPATVTVGTTTTLAAGSSATVTNSGTASAAVLNFGIPQGDAGTAAAGSMGTSSLYLPGLVPDVGEIVHMPPIGATGVNGSVPVLGGGTWNHQATIMYWPLLVQPGLTGLSFGQASINVTTANLYAGNTSCVFRVAIYQDSNGTPGTLLKELPLFSCSSTGMKTVTLTAPMVFDAPGLYWLAWAMENGNSSGSIPTTSGWTVTLTQPLYPSTTWAAAATTVVAYYGGTGRSGGSFASTAELWPNSTNPSTNPSGTPVGCPQLMLKRTA